MTLTRVCAQKKCKELRDGKKVMAEREDDEPEHSADEPEHRLNVRMLVKHGLALTLMRFSTY